MRLRRLLGARGTERRGETVLYLSRAFVLKLPRDISTLLLKYVKIAVRNIRKPKHPSNRRLMAYQLETWSN